MKNGTPPGEPLPLTGERTVPDLPEENYWFRRHEAAYAWLLPHCADAVVLDAGCGEGYGAALIAEVAAAVVAADYDEPSCAHVRARYPQVTTVQTNLVTLPVRSAAVDVVANFQVIEHLWDQVGFLGECRRVLRSGGTLLITTPNRLTFSPGQDTPLNPFHTRELAADELADLLHDAGFGIDFLGGLHHGPRLRELDAAHGGSLIDAQVGVVLGHLPGEAIWPAGLLADVASVLAADFDVHDTDVAASLDLVAVARVPE
ncbi:MAG TPA: methyltransferase domain-containing protein [Pseudonocardiaceae bacterium]|nr:methyltransferase domain-containing protein [Pseudonocardiaceae bacterium]